MAARCFHRLRSRAVDLTLVVAGLALLSTPFLTWAFAAPPLAEREAHVDQKVRTSALISVPLAASFNAPNKGLSVGSVKWDVYSSSKRGYKLAVNADSKPSLTGTGCSMPDIGSDPKPWSIGPGEWGFGVSATGDRVLEAYKANDKQFRGLDGKRPIEVARYRQGASAASRTTVWLAAENNGSADCSKAKVDITGTVLMNL